MTFFLGFTKKFDRLTRSWLMKSPFLHNASEKLREIMRTINDNMMIKKKRKKDDETLHPT